MKKHADLPFASTLCGSCTNVCPVKIDIHNQLYLWRQEITAQGYSPKLKTAAMKVMAATLSRPALFNIGGKLARWVIKHLPFLVNNKLNPWYKQRDLPSAPGQSFTEWYKQNRHEQ
jgi:L-lactate dehydrogenase complex protein LldF